MIRKVTSGLAKLLAAGDKAKLADQIEVQKADANKKIAAANETIMEQGLVLDVVAGFEEQLGDGTEKAQATPAAKTAPTKPATVTSNLPPGQ